MIQDFRLKVFATVAQRLSFSRAAKELSISQPAVSQHIAELEKQCQQPLFVRRGSFIELSPFGQELFPLVMEILKRYDEINQRIQAQEEVQQAPVRIGTTPSLAQHLLPTLLALLRKRLPNLQFKLRTTDSDTLSEQLQAHALDFGFSEEEDPYDGLTYELLLEDPYVLVTASGSAQHLAEHDFPLVPFVSEAELGGTEAVINYLKHADAYAFLPLLAAQDEIQLGRLRRIPTDAPQRKRQYFLVHQNKQDSALLQHLLQIAEQNFKLHKP